MLEIPNPFLLKMNSKFLMLFFFFTPKKWKVKWHHLLTSSAENQIRHVPVVDGKLVGMISIKDVVRAVVEQQSGELKRLNEFIRGEYY